MNFQIEQARNAAAVLRCFPVMRQLRTHIAEERKFLEQVERQRAEGYRMMESLYAGRFCYVDDLVTDETTRSLGYGGALFDWLVAEARTARCERLELDSGVQRFAAHRFYLTKRMIISSHHFSLDL